MPKGVYKHYEGQGFQKGHKQFHDGSALKGRVVSPSTLFKKGHTLNRGVPKSEEHRKKLSEAKKKNPTRYWLGKKRMDMLGSKNPMWAPIKKEDPRKIARKRGEYKEWRRHVFQRDDFTCQACGGRGGKLNADHELPFALFPDLRLEVLNGRTFCVPCHKKIPNTRNAMEMIHML